MALDDYFSDPSQDCLARLFDAVNSMDISQTPRLSRYEKLIMRTSERKDLFIEKYEDLMKPKVVEPVRHNGHHASDSTGSHSSFEDGIMMRARDDKGKGNDAAQRDPGSSTTSLQAANQYSPSDNSFSLDGSAVWVESGSVDQSPRLPTSMGSTHTGSTSRATSVRGRKSTDASSTSSLHARRDDSGAQTPAPNATPPMLKDTHYFPATIDYNDHQLPIRLPMYTFPEEVGDVRA